MPEDEKFEEDICKQYDETMKIDLPSYTVGGIRNHDDVYIRGDLVGTLESGLVAESVKVILSGIELVGEKKDSYYLDLEGFTASVHPTHLEKVVGDKNRIDFSKNVFVPVDSILYVEKIANSNLAKKNYVIKDVYDVYLLSEEEKVDVNENIKVRIKVDESSLKFKRMKIYNYYDGKYETINGYKYENGYLVYESSSLGMIVFAQKELNFWWLNCLIIVTIIVLDCVIAVKLLKSRKKINKYKSLKRRKDYNGDL